MKVPESTMVIMLSRRMRVITGWPSRTASLNLSRRFWGSATPEFSSTNLRGGVTRCQGRRCCACIYKHTWRWRTGRQVQEDSVPVVCDSLLVSQSQELLKA